MRNRGFLIDSVVCFEDHDLEIVRKTCGRGFIGAAGINR